jgi:hypothetical protein
VKSAFRLEVPNNRVAGGSEDAGPAPRTAGLWAGDGRAGRGLFPDFPAPVE